MAKRESETSRAVDPRPARTRAAIRESVRRIASRPGEEISVNAIAKEAGISRSAFYDQYSDLDALSIDMLTDIFHAATTNDKMRLRQGQSLRDAAEAVVSEFLDYLDVHRAFFVCSLEWKTSSKVPETVNATLASNYLQVFDALGEAVPSSLNRHDTALFLAAGTIALITDWMRETRPSSKLDVATRLLAQHPDWLVGRSD